MEIKMFEDDGFEPMTLEQEEKLHAEIENSYCWPTTDIEYYEEIKSLIRTIENTMVSDTKLSCFYIKLYNRKRSAFEQRTDIRFEEWQATLH